MTLTKSAPRLLGDQHAQSVRGTDEHDDDHVERGGGAPNQRSFALNSDEAYAALCPREE